ncbi:MAG TPA: response regulator [Bacteroidales bacterium]|jgi:CheY-like chemotaxis protein|nr:response regulator [Bacteroidales bacterium]
MKIIIADDYYTNRLLVSEILKSLGHDYIIAENGKQALEALENNNDVDLVLMDLEMPVMNGIEAMRYIRDRLVYPKSNIPIIALTAHNPGMYIQEGQESGFNKLMGKPYSIDKIAEVLEYYNS